MELVANGFMKVPEQQNGNHGIENDMGLFSTGNAIIIIQSFLSDDPLASKHKSIFEPVGDEGLKAVYEYGAWMVASKKVVSLVKTWLAKEDCEPLIVYEESMTI